MISSNNTQQRAKERLSADAWEGKIGLTRPAELAVLLFLSSVHVHAPGVEGKGEEVLEARGRTHYGVEAFHPFLTLFKGGELTPDGRYGITERVSPGSQHTSPMLKPEIYPGAGQKNVEASNASIYMYLYIFN